jgi:uncharacterized protein (DUF885 family)
VHRRLILMGVIILAQLLMGGCNQAPPTTQAALPVISPTKNPTTSLPLTATQASSGYLAVDAAAEKLAGLPIDQFFEESFKKLMLRDPEGVTIEGLSKMFGMRDDQLTDISDGYIRETQALQKMIALMLRSYDRAALNQQQQISYDVYAWYLDDLIRQHEFMYNDYPVSQVVVSGVQYVTLLLFTDFQPVTNLQEAQDYVTRLGQVNTKFEQLIDGLKRREQAGIIPPRVVIQRSLGDIRSLGSNVPWDSPFYKSLETKVNALKGVEAIDKQAVLKAASEAMKESVLPAYRALGDYLEGLLPKAPIQDGLWQYANGEAYYNDYLIPHMTTGDMNAEEIHQLGLKELERIQAEMRPIFEKLGYPKGEHLRLSCWRASEDGGLVHAGSLLRTYKQYIDRATQNLDQVFDLKPKAELVLVSGAGNNPFYVGASYDGTRPGILYVPLGGSQYKMSMPTLAYHEGVPGHHFQVSIAREADLPLFRNVINFNAYTEGWALYAERLVSELGWYQDDPYGDLGRLQSEALRAARLVVDTGLHVKKWTFNQAVEYLVNEACWPMYAMDGEVARYIATPGQALGYDFGMVKLLELRQRAKDQLGEKFDLKEFHNLVLGNGIMPLTVLEEVVEEYIVSKLSGGAN